MEDHDEADDQFSVDIEPVHIKTRPVSMRAPTPVTSLGKPPANRRTSLRGKLSSMTMPKPHGSGQFAEVRTDRTDSHSSLRSGGGGHNSVSSMGNNPKGLTKVLTQMDRRRSSIMTRMGISSSGRFVHNEDTAAAATGKNNRISLLKKPASSQMTTEDLAWEERWTIDELPYYYNHKTEAVTWEKPDALKSQEELELDGEWTWVPHPTNVWQGARVIKRQQNGDVHVKTISQPPKTMVIPSSRSIRNADTNMRDQKVPLWPLIKSSLYLLEDDLVALDDPNEGLILHNLRMRFAENKLYTWVGASRSVLVSVNPYRNITDLYSDASITQQREKSPNRPPPPHVFGIASDALDSLLYDAKSNSILISGESGSGKTEATKHCLRYLAKVAGTKSHVEKRVLEANPILESFGNAKTMRNRNSSRFGKWIEVNFDSKSRQISGASITTYLLERSRVVYQTKGERNFHIFYALLSSPDFRSQYGLTQPLTYYRYVNTSFSVEGLDDAKQMQIVIRALNEMGFDNEEQEWIFRTLSALLHLGQVDFVENMEEEKGSGGCHVSPLKRSTTQGTRNGVSKDQRRSSLDKYDAESGVFHLKEASRLLQLDTKELEQKLCFRTMRIRGETSVIPLSVADAGLGADSFAMTIYSRLFEWLIARLNQSLGGSGKGHFIGILDIFGFEIFDKNSFEQLCINFANEKLQAQFNSSMFEEEEGLYTFEGIDFEKVAFQSNTEVLQLIEEKTNGLLPQLDDEVRGVGGTDERFVSKMAKLHETNSRFQVDLKKRMESPCAFQIVHYAGVVKYDATGFVRANNDTLYEDLYILASTQTADKHLRFLFPMEDGHASVFAPQFPGAQTASVKQGKSGGGGGHRGRSETNEPHSKMSMAGGTSTSSSKKRVNTVGGTFTEELNSLLELLEQTESRFIRCVKPNSSQQPELFESMLVLEQLKYSGVFEAVEIRRKGFPFRWTHRQFVFQYKIIHNHRTQKGELVFKSRGDDYEGLAQEILDNQPGKPKPFRDVKVGRTRVLYRAKEHKLLLLLRNLALERMIPWLQARLRGYIARNMKRIFRECDEILQDAIDLENDLDALERAFEETDELIGDIIPDLFPNAKPLKRRVAEKLVRELKEWEEVELIMEDLENDPREIRELFFEMRNCLDRVEQVKHIPMTRRQERLVENLQEKVSSCELQQIEERISLMEARTQAALESMDAIKMRQAVHEWTIDKEARDRFCAPLEKIKQVLVAMQDAEARMKKSLLVLDREEMKLASAEAAPLFPRGHEDLTAIATKLALPELDFCQLELAVSIRDKDVKRKNHREIFLFMHKLNTLYLSRPPGLGNLLEHKFWRNVEDWMKKASFMDRKLRKEKMTKAFKFWNPKPIHFPLTSFGFLADSHGDNPERRSNAVLMYKLVLTMFGCVVANEPLRSADEAIAELLAMCQRDPPLRFELMMQIVKMLHTNPDSSSVDKGEEFLGMWMLVCEFESNDGDFENHVFMWFANRFGGNENAKTLKYWAAMITRRYDGLAVTQSKKVAQLRQEWHSLVISPHALQPGQSTGPSLKS